MDKKTIQDKKEKLEVEFKTIEENRVKAQEIVSQCTQNLIRLQGAYAQLLDLEKEFTDKDFEKTT